MTDLYRYQIKTLRDVSAAISGAAGLLSDVVGDFEVADSAEWPEHWHPGRIVAVLDLINHAAHGQYLTLIKSIGEGDHV